MSSFTFEANLFRVGPDRNLSFPGAPTLVPDNGNNYDVNVYSEYPWTVSDDARNYIPKLLLTEYKLTYASELNAFNQSIKGFFGNIFVVARTRFAILMRQRHQRLIEIDIAPRSTSKSHFEERSSPFTALDVGTFYWAR